MPPRRQGGVPLGRGRGRVAGNEIVLEELRRLHIRMEAMEMNQRINIESSYISDEAEVQSSEEEEEETQDERIFRMLAKVSIKQRWKFLCMM